MSGQSGSGGGASSEAGRGGPVAGSGTANAPAQQSTQNLNQIVREVHLICLRSFAVDSLYPIPNPTHIPFCSPRRSELWPWPRTWFLIRPLGKRVCSWLHWDIHIIIYAGRTGEGLSLDATRTWDHNDSSNRRETQRQDFGLVTAVWETRTTTTSYDGFRCAGYADGVERGAAGSSYPFCLPYRSYSRSRHQACVQWWPSTPSCPTV